MYASGAPRSLICYRDIRANNIHISTAVEIDEEALELRQGQSLLATATAGANGLYELPIRIMGRSHFPQRDEDELGTSANTSKLVAKDCKEGMSFLTASV